MRLAATTSTMSTIVVGLNAALQKRFIMNDPLMVGNVHRASSVQTGVGGKGQDVHIALQCLNYHHFPREDPSNQQQQHHSQLLQFVGRGPEGDQVLELLGMVDDAAAALTVRVHAPLRTCTSIVSPDATTELVEPSGTIQKEELDELLLDRIVPQSAESLVIMGSMPPGCPAGTYADIYQRVSKPDHTLCLIDSVVGLEPLLKEIQSPTLLKINRAELCSLAGIPDATTSVNEAVQAFCKVLPVNNVAGLAITDGASPGHLVLLDKDVTIYQLPIPKLTKDLLFPIGAGDAVAAGTMAAWMYLTGKARLAAPLQQVLDEATADPTLVQAFRFGLACGSASCLQEENSVLKVEDAVRLYQSSNAPVALSAMA